MARGNHCKWCLLPDGRIRRWERGVLKTHPKARYRHLLGKPVELQAYLGRLNAEITTRRTLEIRHKWISQEIQNRYEEELGLRTTSKDARREMEALKKHFLYFFIHTLELPDPNDWYRTQTNQWAKYLMGPDAPPSAGSKKQLIQAANRFMKWLHRQMPDKIPLYRFEPLTLKNFKDADEARRLRGELRKERYIQPDVWKQIEGGLPGVIRAAVMLAYYFGLRRSEVLGLRLDDVTVDVLWVQRQRTNSAGAVKGPKGKIDREVPYWFCSPEEAYQLVTQLPTRMHPDSLTDQWDTYMKKLKLDHVFHDLRHTWITLALAKNGKDARVVQLAAGHKDISTTMKYAHDHRVHDKRPFKPKKVVKAA